MSNDDRLRETNAEKLLQSVTGDQSSPAIALASNALPLDDRVPCPCAADSKLRPAHFFEGLLELIIRCSCLALAFALIWAFAEGMRTYGTSPLLLPFSTLGQYQPRLHTTVNSNPLIIAFDNFLFFYNCAFPGANRLGSGIGIIAGAFWTLHRVPHSCIPRRAYLGAIAGAVIGFRMMMMVSSSATIVFGAMLLGAIGIALYMVAADQRTRVPDLPLVVMEK
ncbi:MAG: hypothetical protein K2X77_24315 [Candidatus Obscuribacterales bacterium]|jgi:hypothetical protein|nr:hypothetical protein [Candidatus Obscuribacterales bacterium]